ncbi:MAG: CvpA family protein [Planctomycetota bacterium]|jgi:hypothetical protein
MFALLGIIAGIAFAYYGLKRGFFEMWGNFFNLLISFYLALFLRPVIVEYISGAGNSWLGIFLSILLTGVAIFLVLFGISYVAFGQFKIELPKLFDIAGGALMGFLGGVLLWGFLIFLLSMTPLSQSSLAKSIGMAKYSVENKASYLCWWGDAINLFAGSSQNHRSTEEVMGEIFGTANVAIGKTKPKTKETQQIVPDPNQAPKELRPIEEELGSPPELDFEII